MNVLDTFQLQGRRALITGSSAGIGLALAEALAQAGAHVILNGRTASKVEAATGGPLLRVGHMPAGCVSHLLLAKLRGDFIRQAKISKRDFTVDWVHLKLNDETPKTVVCKDPFQSVDDRVQRLIDTL